LDDRRRSIIHAFAIVHLLEPVHNNLTEKLVKAFSALKQEGLT